jgi:DNA polymerase III epsilon subunit-like protein
MAKLLIVDTETGGVDPGMHSILSVGAVVWDDGQLGAEFEVLIAEDSIQVTERAMEINGIDLSAHRCSGLSPASAMARFAEFLREHFRDELATGAKIALAGHNIGFDIGFLKRLCRYAGVEFDAFFSHRSLDTAAVIRFLSLAGVLPLASAGSDEAFSYFGVPFGAGTRHTALGDARATAHLLNSLIKAAAARPTGDAASTAPSGAGWAAAASVHAD